MKRGTWLAVLGIGVLFAAGQALAQDKPADKAKDAKQPAAAKPAEKATGAKSYDKPKEGAHGGDDKMMAMMAEYATPGPEHAKLKPLAGNWSCDVKCWMDPSGEPETSSGRLTRKWILGDRYLSEDFEGTFMGQPFQGHGIIGYDKGQKKYTMTWIDTMGTGIFQQTGNATGNTLTFEGQNFCPIQGGPKWTKSTIEVAGDKSTMKMFEKGPDAKEMQTMEITCSRK